MVKQRPTGSDSPAHFNLSGTLGPVHSLEDLELLTTIGAYCSPSSLHEGQIMVLPAYDLFLRGVHQQTPTTWPHVALIIVVHRVHHPSITGVRIYMRARMHDVCAPGWRSVLFLSLRTACSTHRLLQIQR